MKLILVEDDALIAYIMGNSLRHLGCEYLVSRTGNELPVWLMDPNIRAVLSDYILAGPRDGIELLKLTRRQRPDVRRVLVTGLPWIRAVTIALASGDVERLVPKPYLNDVLFSALAGLR